MFFYFRSVFHSIEFFLMCYTFLFIFHFTLSSFFPLLGKLSQSRSVRSVERENVNSHRSFTHREGARRLPEFANLTNYQQSSVAAAAFAERANGIARISAPRRIERGLQCQQPQFLDATVHRRRVYRKNFENVDETETVGCEELLKSNRFQLGACACVGSYPSVSFR